MRKLCIAQIFPQRSAFPRPIPDQLLHILSRWGIAFAHMRTFDMAVYLKGFLFGAPEGLFLLAPCQSIWAVIMQHANL